VVSDIWVEREQLLDRIRSYPESFDRDKVLVEQLGKQWDMGKAMSDDLAHRNEKWGLPGDVASGLFTEVPRTGVLGSPLAER
jgi:hypothetical protein